jgi:hypothetical protein
LTNLQLIDRIGEMPPLLSPPLQPEQQVGDLLDLVGDMITVGLIALVYEGSSGPVPLRWARGGMQAGATHDQRAGLVVDGGARGLQRHAADPVVVTAQQQLNRVRPAAR